MDTPGAKGSAQDATFVQGGGKRGRTLEDDRQQRIVAIETRIAKLEGHLAGAKADLAAAKAEARKGTN